MMKSTTAYIGLGSNLGNRRSYIKRALKALAETRHIQLCGLSDIIETNPLGQMNQPNYLNAVAELKTNLTAQSLYKTLTHIEKKLGRVAREKWAPRTIDLDLLLFGQEVKRLPHLTIPHPQMHLRSFVLKGLRQLNGDLLHPVIKEPVSELARRLGGRDFVLNPDVPQLISMAGVIGVGKTTLARKLSNLLARRLPATCPPLARHPCGGSVWRVRVAGPSGGLGCKIFLEPYNTNPFLPAVYAGKKELALDSQLYFLTNRTQQLNRDTLPAGRITISDYIFDKELIYAGLLLSRQQLGLYKRIYPSFAAKVAPPVLVIYMQDRSRKCLERIHKRNRPYEQKIKLQFLDAIDSAHQRLFSDWKTCPVIRLSGSNFDCTKPADVRCLANQIRCYVAVNSTRSRNPKPKRYTLYAKR
jgi:2-amino-4-hydroxy-6-hydroxymethyldihydropteridine diphosphokinase